MNPSVIPTFIPRRLHARPFGIMGLLFDPDPVPGAGGEGGDSGTPPGSTEWPEDRGPAHLQGGGNTPSPGANGDPSPTPSGRTPAATPPAGNAQPAAGPTQAQYDELQGRFTALEQQLNGLNGQNGYMRRIVSAVLGRDLPGPQQPQTEEERRNAAIRERFLQVFPELKQLGDLVKGRQTDQETAERNAEAHAKRHINAALNHVAGQMLGQGKVMKDLSPRQQAWIRDAFINWVESDEQRIADYDAGQVDYAAFWADYHREMRADSARATAAVIEDRAGRVAALPSGGPSSAPVGQAPPELNMLDEDAVHKAAWKNATAGRR